MLTKEQQLKLWQACDLQPSDDDADKAAAMTASFMRESRAYRAGLIDDPRPDPALNLLGVHGVVVMRADGQQVFVPGPLVVLRGCRCYA